MAQSFDSTFRDLPAELPVFPLLRVILLPRVELPLNIFEPRYIALTEHALSNARLIGMVQPREGDSVFRTGCAGRIVSFSETGDGRYQVTLRGVCRFDIREELAPDARGFRRARADWSPYAGDLAEDESHDVCRETLMNTLRRYFERMNMHCERWEDMHSISCERLVSTLSVICPLATEDKQALLEAPTLRDRAEVLQAVLEKAGVKEKERTLCH